MKLLFKNHVPVANKMLILFSGLNKNAVDRNGKKVYELHHFNIKKRWASITWTKSLIKQTIAYLSLTDRHGSIGVISMNQLGNEIQTSTRTIKNNNRKLEAIGLIKAKTLWGDFISVEFVNYRENCLDLFTDSKAGSAITNVDLFTDEEEVTYYSHTGYTTIKDTALQDLFAIKNVNELRMACRSLYIYEKEVNVGKKSTAVITYKDFKGILPNYYAYKASIKRGFSAIKKLFPHSALEKENVLHTLLETQKTTPSLLQKLESNFAISFNVNPLRDSRHVLNKEVAASYVSFEAFCHFVNIKPLHEVQQRSLIIEFGLDTVKEAINEMYELFNSPFSAERCEFIDGIDSEPIKTMRKFMKKHQGGQIAI